MRFLECPEIHDDAENEIGDTDDMRGRSYVGI